MGEQLDNQKKMSDMMEEQRRKAMLQSVPTAQLMDIARGGV
jgi:hypothetical protein